MQSTKSGPASPTQHHPVGVIGAGPAGLTAAYQLTRRGAQTIVLEQDVRVGGIAQTAEYKGFRFDIGGHRFFTKVRIVQELWQEVLGRDFLRRPRLSRIYYNSRFFDYPLKPLNALRNLGVGTSAAVLVSYLRAQVRPVRPEVSFADWVTNRFGRRLYKIFFETYTEKVWGIPCRTISAQWAGQRIKGLSLLTAVKSMLFPNWGRGNIKTLIDEFDYPRLGPGQMWEAFRDRVVERGAEVRLETRVERLHHDGARVTEIEVLHAGQQSRLPVSHVVSTMPMRHLIHALTPPAPPDIVRAADQLRYRDFLTVALIVDDPALFPDNWIYIHDDTVKVGRIQNFKNWSPDMVPDASKTCVGLEYFCFEGDGLWATDDRALVALATRELASIGLARAESIVDGCVLRMPKAYPIYDEAYAAAVDTLKAYLERFDNLHLVGRNGMHKYNNQDHSMLTAILAVENIYGASHNLWAVNAEDEYHEEARTTDTDAALADQIRALSRTQPAVPVALDVNSSDLTGQRGTASTPAGSSA